MSDQSSIATSLQEIRQRVKSAEAKRGVGKDVRLVAVSKTKPNSDLMEAYDQGQRHFGENIQELVDKATQLPKDIQWHFIGTLQSNKCKLLATVSNLWAVETIDSQKKADVMSKAWPAEHEPLRVFIQVNTSRESSKSGVKPSECVSVAEHIATKCQQLKLLGLMTIGSADRDPEVENPDFKTLVDCKKAVDEKLDLDVELSMGMSDDFESAIHSGATNVRVGSSIFGARNYAK
ncbi:alanine racemase [Powellomyces hirtus]|uniref:Pyridoxal phosphate homeostasis protein n=1 Tax=Powellomyces hirtus TaxID=109895 RepID=A0A507EA56_9FUNG|nr:alanine racemase [Powellomyces hirtus]